MKTVVVAIGGNAITKNNQKGTPEEQIGNIEDCCELVADLIEEGYQIILTHGNGPQVGNIVLQNDIAKHHVPENPLDICGAQTQGSLGYLISQKLTNVLTRRKIQKEVATVLTQVLVDKEDKSFQDPTKFIGPFFTEEEAEEIRSQKGFDMRLDSNRGYRRVVPSPKPLELIEKKAIKTLIKEGFILITVGGGGIPVVQTDKGDFEGVEAVIDKDLTSALVAKEVGADVLMILTGVSKVCINYGTKDEKELDEISLKECQAYFEEGQFPPGSMGPKIEASMGFVKSGGETIITSIEHMKDALAGKDGTRIY
ncbi:MAG: carbamate kinase [Lachnospiraceae bacterium]